MHWHSHLPETLCYNLLWIPKDHYLGWINCPCWETLGWISVHQTKTLPEPWNSITSQRMVRPRAYLGNRFPGFPGLLCQTVSLGFANSRLKFIINRLSCVVRRSSYWIFNARYSQNRYPPTLVPSTFSVCLLKTFLRHSLRLLTEHQPTRTGF